MPEQERASRIGNEQFLNEVENSMREDEQEQSNGGPSDDKNQQNEEQEEDGDQIQEPEPASTIEDGQLLNEDKN